MPVSVGRLLTEFVELQQVATRKQIQIMSEHTRCPVTKPKLLAFVGEDAASTERYRADILGKRKSVFDLLEEHPACELPFHAYLEMLSLLAPRYYSISSSPSVDPARCSVTVAVVEGPASSGRGIYKGVCSNYLAGRRTGETIHATVRETKAGFRLPDDRCGADHHDRPRHRARAVPRFPAGARGAQGARRHARTGDAVLRLPSSRPGFSLCRRAEGVCGRAASPNCTPRSRARDGPKTYVQNLVAAQKERVWSLIEQGAIIYVCGDGGKMEPDVKATLVAIYRERTGARCGSGLSAGSRISARRTATCSMCGRAADSNGS